MTDEKLAEIEKIVKKSDIIWFGKFKEEYSRDSDGHYELENRVIEDTGEVTVNEMLDLIAALRTERAQVVELKKENKRLEPKSNLQQKEYQRTYKQMCQYAQELDELKPI